LAESVTIESTPDVPIRAMCGMSSIASWAKYFPSLIPFERMRAAVRLAILMPSPMNRMTFRATRGPVANTVQVTSLRRVPSLATTL
jgi:hypothetical protein